MICDLGRIGMVPIGIVARFPASVRRDGHLDAGALHRSVDRFQIVDQTDFLGDGLDAGPDLAAFGEEVVIGIDEEIGGAIEGDRRSSRVSDQCWAERPGADPTANGFPALQMVG